MDQKDTERPRELSPESARQFASRRTVLKGLSSLPVAVTLASGQTAAAASALQCAASPPNTGEPLELSFPPGSDPMQALPGTSSPVLYVNGNQPAGQQVIYEEFNGTPFGENQYRQVMFAVDSNGDGVTEQTALLASCYTSFVQV